MRKKSSGRILRDAIMYAKERTAKEIQSTLSVEGECHRLTKVFAESIQQYILDDDFVEFICQLIKKQEGKNGR